MLRRNAPSASSRGGGLSRPASGGLAGIRAFKAPTRTVKPKGEVGIPTDIDGPTQESSTSGAELDGSQGAPSHENPQASLSTPTSATSSSTSLCRKVPASDAAASPVPAKRIRIPLPVTAPVTSQSPAPTHYAVLWRRRTNKKHKSWDGDGHLVVGSACTLKDTNGREVTRGRIPSEPIENGLLLSLGAYEVEVTDLLSSAPAAQPTSLAPSPAPAPPSQPAPPSSSSSSSSSYRPPMRATPTSIPTAARKTINTELTPLHNPNAPNALVLARPPATSDGYPVVDVVVDPILASKLRPHQRQGVEFMYECVMGYKTEAASGHVVHGSILADDPGLGKTLMAITLMWTLLHQHPHGRSRAIGRALVVCPASLVANWAKEIKKWLGDERLATFPVNANTDVHHFLSGKASRVMIIGYERLRLLQSIVSQCNFGLVICDEGHRLKNATAKTSEALNMIATKRRVVLSGTPLQNDLMEYFAMVDYVNPGILGTAAEFRAAYEAPIVAGRQPGATPEEREAAQDWARELSQVCELFVLRRLCEVNRAYLPPKHEMMVFCRPTRDQAQAYEQVIEHVQRAAEGGDNQALPWIAKLKKVCNWMQPPPAAPGDLTSGECSAKYHFISVLLEVVLADTQEKVVLVSNSTGTLDQLEDLCRGMQADTLRLDGSTSVEKRQDLVNAFNSPTHPSRVFLLSAKAGGVGLNLIGASRLVLCDIDWNPAICQQSKARVWRDGQLRPVHIYRLLLSGSLEENMAQRQINKLSLSTHIVDGAMTESGDAFSTEDMAQLFSLDRETNSSLHDALGCECNMDGEEVLEHGWRHIGPDPSTGAVSPGCFKDRVTRQVVKKVGASIGFVFSDA